MCAGVVCDGVRRPCTRCEQQVGTPFDAIWWLLIAAIGLLILFNLPPTDTDGWFFLAGAAGIVIGIFGAIWEVFRGR